MEALKNQRKMLARSLCVCTVGKQHQQAENNGGINMSIKTQIKIIEHNYADVMERKVNNFINCLEGEPTRITFGNSFYADFDDGYFYRPTYTAVIEYLATPANKEAVEQYCKMYE